MPIPETPQLWKDGYRVYVKSRTELFVRKPNGEKYVVNPFAQTCSCPAGARGIACKHKEEWNLYNLVFLSVDRLCDLGRTQEGKALYNFWYGYTSGEGKR